MRVEVRLFAGLRDRLPRDRRGRGAVDLPDGASLQDLLDRLEIPERQAQMVLVNGDQAPRRRDARSGWKLKEHDAVSIFPPLAGG